VGGGGGSIWARNGTPFILYVFTAIVSPVGFVKTFKGIHLSKESVYLTILVSTVFFKGEKLT
jgi:hypothetical protein